MFVVLIVFQLQVPNDGGGVSEEDGNNDDDEVNIT